MAFCSSLAYILVKCGVAEANMDSDTYYRGVIPIAALFAVTLWCGNAAYMYLSVAFIQMIKALMPAAVYTVGCFLGTEKYSVSYVGNMLIISIGVAIASYGEINFDLLGVIFQGASIVSESTRLGLIQILLQSRGVKLNPVTTLYYVAPPCFVFLMVPWSYLEMNKVLTEPLIINPWILLASAASAFALNVAVFLLIGKTSALTMNVAGVIKDWLLIFLSFGMFHAPITSIQLVGYGVAFLGVCWYNYLKSQPAPAAAKKLAEDTATSQSKEPLLDSTSQDKERI
jgi:hypothetical protein